MHTRRKRLEIPPVFLTCQGRPLQETETVLGGGRGSGKRSAECGWAAVWYCCCCQGKKGPPKNPPQMLRLTAAPSSPRRSEGGKTSTSAYVSVSGKLGDDPVTRRK